MKLLYKMKFRYKDPSIRMEICYSKHQGKNRLIKRFMCDKPFAASANGGMWNLGINFYYFFCKYIFVIKF